MTRSNFRSFHVVALAIATLLASAGNVLAQKKEDQTTSDARLEGYGKVVAVDGSTATMWMLLIVLTLMTLGVLLKNANRSHLD
jgi:Ser/Thr protein kinase RdoA (MazF antagonist)